MVRMKNQEEKADERTLMIEESSSSNHHYRHHDVKSEQPIEDFFEDTTMIHPTTELFSMEDIVQVKHGGNLDDDDGDDDVRKLRMISSSCCSASIGDLRKTMRSGGDVLEKFEDFLQSDSLKKFGTLCGIEIEKYEEPHSWYKESSDIPRSSPSPPKTTSTATNASRKSAHDVHDVINPQSAAASSSSLSSIDDVIKNKSRYGIHQILLDKNQDESQRLALVFHGTHPDNIKHILKEGLDPKRRRGQAYGEGEYFSRDPSVCVSYCKSGNAIIAFVVLVPFPESMNDDDDSKTTTARRRYTPTELVLVKESRHQFPIGVISFGEVSQVAWNRSRGIKSEMKMAFERVQQNVTETQDAQRKALIIQLLIQSKVDLAAEKYEKFHRRLSISQKREISMYVREIVDDDIVPCLFPDLPPPFDRDEFKKRENRTVEWHIENVKRAKSDFDSTRENKKQKEKFLMFTRVLIKYLEQKDKRLHQQAKIIIRDCAERNKRQEPGYESITESMRRRLKELVGDHYWRKANYYLILFIERKRKGVNSTF